MSTTYCLWITDLNTFSAYVVGDNKDAAILLIHDVFGWTFPNLRLLADHFAKEANATCYLVDLYVSSCLLPSLVVDLLSLASPHAIARHNTRPQTKTFTPSLASTAKSSSPIRLPTKKSARTSTSWPSSAATVRTQHTSSVP